MLKPVSCLFPSLHFWVAVFDAFFLVGIEDLERRNMAELEESGAKVKHVYVHIAVSQKR
jgi:hypothetical protein